MAKWVWGAFLLVGCGFDTRPLSFDADKAYDEDDVVFVRDDGSRDRQPNVNPAGDAGGTGAPEAGAPGRLDAGRGEPEEDELDAAGADPTDSGVGMEDATLPAPDAAAPPDATQPAPDAATPPDTGAPPDEQGDVCEPCSVSQPCAGELHCLQLTSSETGACLPISAFQQPCSELCAGELPHAYMVLTAAGLQQVCAPEASFVEGCAGFLARSVRCD